ncbi:uncharacterized protein A4U43_C04F3440 [Asparagus officinalis]|uniref:Uncharacterized protein n=1 Tax=Asparagus officinalis TaxID=4686 RepID=A0A5P1EY13_ASPOF|nr:uncharacterized protein A4U43_C04F3440 [Asparagus officinalis]
MDRAMLAFAFSLAFFLLQGAESTTFTSKTNCPTQSGQPHWRAHPLHSYPSGIRAPSGAPRLPRRHRWHADSGPDRLRADPPEVLLPDGDCVRAAGVINGAGGKPPPPS